MQRHLQKKSLSFLGKLFFLLIVLFFLIYIFIHLHVEEKAATNVSAIANTIFSLTVCPHGLGNCGDNANPNGGGNSNPLTQNRQVTISVLDAGNSVVATKQGSVLYSSTTKNFNGSIDMGTLASGNYLVSIKMNGYLSKQVPGIIAVTSGQTSTLPEIYLTAGNINNDNQLDIQDYNILISCFGSKTCTNKKESDINDDGVVDGSDYNLFLRELSVQKGDGGSSITPQPTQNPVVHFSTLPPGSALPSDAQCAAVVRRNPNFEPRPDNNTPNHTVGFSQGHATGTYLSQYGAGYEDRITGNFTGTTDEIFQWGACKWGFDEDNVRAQAVTESHWHQSQLGDCHYTTQPEANGCGSVGVLQVKGANIPPTHPGTWPYAFTSTAFNIDYTLAVRRACFEGKETWLGNGYKAGDEWGCIGRWYSGAWHDPGESTYISSVQGHYDNKDWLQPGF